MKSFVLLFLLVASSVLLYAQRPLSIEALQPKVDSMHKVANELYERLQFIDTLTAVAKKRDISFNHHLSYYKNSGDTLIGLLINNANEVILELHVNPPKFNNTFSNFSKRPLAEKEQALLALKLSAIKTAQKSKYEIVVPKNCYLEYLLLSNNQKNYFYVLTLSRQDSTIHFGNDFRFIYTNINQLTHWEKISNYRKESVKVEDIGHTENQKIELLFLPARRGKQLPDAATIAKFRRYHQNISLEECTLFCNKREFNYLAESNELTIKLFPNERM